jgi:hypothetical protein
MIFQAVTILAVEAVIAELEGGVHSIKRKHRKQA